MTSIKSPCPKCKRPLTIIQALPARVKCPKCGARFEIAADGTTTLAASRVTEKAALTNGLQPPQLAPTVPPEAWWESIGSEATSGSGDRPIISPIQSAQSLPSKSAARRIRKESRPVWALPLILGGLGTLLILAVALLVYCLSGDNPEPVAAQTPEGEDAPVIVQSSNKNNKEVKDPPKTPAKDPEVEKKPPPDPEPKKEPESKKDPEPKKDPLPILSGDPDPSKESEPKKPDPDPVKPPPSDDSSKLVIKVIETTKTETVGPKPLRLAVTPSTWDNMAKLLDKLGAGYKYKMVNDIELRNAQKFDEFDVLFLTCGGAAPELKENLRNFVARGGTLYASDLRYPCIAKAFPDFVNKKYEGYGLANQFVQAKVKDPGLKAILGKQVVLKFDAGGWRPAAFAGPKVTTLLEGTYKGTTGAMGLNLAAARAHFSPLLVKFPFGEGTVIFTSFHNEKQNSKTEDKLLKYLVFSAVTAQVETKVTKTMISGGFSPRQSARLSTSATDPKITHKYHNKKAGRLQFALGFEDRGAKLRLTLISPSGEKIEKEGTFTFTVQIDNAPEGDWTYTVTALQVPFANFPFTLTVGEAGKE
jgi:hypothetical protein